MKALVHLGFGEKIPDCTRCEGEQRVRVAYGCDEPAPSPVFFVSCGCVNGCARCKEGALALYRCPGKLTEGRRDIREAYWLCRQYEENGTLPSPGGLADQSPAWLTLLHVYQSERAAIAAAPAKNAEKKQRRIDELIAARANARG